MIFARFWDFGIWTGAIESLVFTCGILVLLASGVRVAAMVSLLTVRALVRVREMGKARESAAE
ncbi:hypothetical protein D3880_03980 [Pseudomonas cavernae]|uniref:Uncharacterized protein n=1 Tax=Pseudomonas cavernae TaxID=2320867 RepID=A0A385Z177_9PSED|nr:hypothetical protein D3880_03980 [Pseudomonas cavernae]